MESTMTLRDKFEADGTTLAGVQGALAEECLNETVTEIGRDAHYVLSQLDCGDYILDVLASGDTILIAEEDIDQEYHSDIQHLRK
jgi:hypothetical protein